MRIAETENDKHLKTLGCDLIDEYRQAVEIAEFTPGKKVFDVATGSGRMAATLSAAGFSVLSGDIDPEVLERAKSRLMESGLDSVEFVVLDALKIPFMSEFASVMCANAIHHLADPVLAISEMADSCAKDGKLVIIEFNTNGFEVMEALHKMQHKGLHEKSSLDSKGIANQLEAHFSRVDCHRLLLNNVWVAQEKIA